MDCNVCCNPRKAKIIFFFQFIGSQSARGINCAFACSCLKIQLPCCNIFLVVGIGCSWHFWDPGSLVNHSNELRYIVVVIRLFNKTSSVRNCKLYLKPNPSGLPFDGLKYHIKTRFWFQGSNVHKNWVRISVRRGWEKWMHHGPSTAVSHPGVT